MKEYKNIRDVLELFGDSSVMLAHTHLGVPGIPNYDGETVPRKILLVQHVFEGGGHFYISICKQ